MKVEDFNYYWRQANASSDQDLAVCPECKDPSKIADWREGEAGCEDCGTHSATVCPQCRELFDWVWNSDKPITVISHMTRTDIVNAIVWNNFVSCYHCLKTFDPFHINDWCNTSRGPEPHHDNCPLCPHCGIDAIVRKLSKEELETHYERCFGGLDEH